MREKTVKRSYDPKAELWYQLKVAYSELEEAKKKDDHEWIGKCETTINDLESAIKTKK